jgi:hypothetical protein
MSPVNSRPYGIGEALAASPAIEERAFILPVNTSDSDVVFRLKAEIGAVSVRT